MAAKAKAVSYLRVSGKGQLDGDGFGRQRDTIARYAKANGLEIAQEFQEQGVSGTNDLDDRPALGSLLDKLESNGVRVVLVENASRLARDLMVQEIILERCRSLGLRVIEADGGNDLTVGDDNPTATLIRQILGAVAQFDKAVTVHKLRAARVRMRRTEGRCEGRKPYGYRPGEQTVVERIVALRRKPRGGERASFADIADMLNTDGVPTRYGKPWNAAVIRSICVRASKQVKD
jgi:DNA invertase Pin-like site-specific DNA recombinase